MKTYDNLDVEQAIRQIQRKTNQNKENPVGMKLVALLNARLYVKIPSSNERSILDENFKLFSSQCVHLIWKRTETQKLMLSFLQHM